MIRFSPCPSILVHGRHLEPDWTSRRILVLTDGSVASKRRRNWRLSAVV
ncbi:MAG: hypothetical protein ACOCYT_02490 [Chloroflexota bacterium]